MRIVLGIIFLLLVMTAFLTAGSNTYFVSPQGSDSNSGLSVERPLRTINTAIGKAIAGDTVFILPGRYRELIIFSGKHGAPENPICLMGYAADSAHYPLIDGGALRPSSNATDDWMHIANSHWIEVARLKFRNGWTFPIRVDSSSYLTFRECRFWGGKRVINASSPTTHHLLVEDCFWDQGGDFLWRIEKDPDGVPAWTAMHHGSMAYFNGSLIDFHGTGGSIVIRRNTVVNAYQAVRYRGEKGHDSNVEIYDNHVSNARDNDFEPEYYTYNLHVYHNVSHNIHRTLSVDNVEGGEIFYYGNVITADSDPWSVNICTGLWKVYGRERFLSYPIYAFNNSFYSAGTAFHSDVDKTTKLKHFNNAYLFFKSGGWKLRQADSSDAFDHDISNKAWPSSMTFFQQERHGRIARINYVDPERGDLRLQPGSPGIDEGTPVRLSEFDWEQSFSGKAPDVGAYEDGNLVEGPPFRFMVPPGGDVSYNEKPRIVRCKRTADRVVIYFSERIVPSSAKPEDLELFDGNAKLAVVSVSFPRNAYEMVIETKPVSTSGELSLSFTRLPAGANGERVTYWASAIKVHKSITTSN